MGMTQINLTLPDSLQEYVEGRVSHGEFGTPNEFIRTLIRRDREQRLAALEAEMLEALAGGRTELSTEELTGGNLVAILKSKPSL
jgi:putative addiction module CopG family antidote